MLWLAFWLLLGGQLGLLVGAWLVVVVWIPVAVAAAALLQIGRPRIVASATLAALTLGFLIGWQSIPPHSDSLSFAAARHSQPIALRAVVESAAVWSPNPNYREEDPESPPWKTEWKIRCFEVLQDRQWNTIDAQSVLRLDGRVEDYFPGDVLEIHGSYRRIGTTTNPGGFDFAAHSRLKSQFVFVAAKDQDQIQKLHSLSTYPLARLRAYAVLAVDQNIRRWIAEPHAPLAAALTFGQRQQVDWQDKQQLMATGTLHLLAISGLHVEIVASCIAFLSLFVFRARSWRFLLVVGACMFYALLADGKPPVLRAVVVVAAFQLAQWQGRKARLTNILGFAAVVLFLFQATYIQNIGVHLSFLAVATIGIFVLATRGEEPKSHLERFLEKRLDRSARVAKLGIKSVSQMLRLSFWVWLITAPLIWTHFHVIAPIAVVLNVLISIPLTFSLLSGLIVGVLGWIPPVGWAFGMLCSHSLGLIDRLVEFGHGVEAGHFWLPAPNAWWLCAFYGLALLWLVIFKTQRRHWLAGLLTLWLLCGMYWSSNNRPLTRSISSEQLDIIFLDVGHGTSVVILTPEQEVWLYDAGHLGDSDRSHLPIANALWNVGVSRIDRLILSHADADHYNAATALLNRFDVASVVSTRRFWANAAPGVRELVHQVQEATISQDTWEAGDHMQSGSLACSVLHPRSQQAHESDNASSLCLLLEYQGKKVLLPGDLDGTGLFGLTRAPPRHCDLLMAPHHGSLSQDPSSILEWCRPERVVISGNYRAVRPEVLQEYAQAFTLVTYRHGAIRYSIDPSGADKLEHWNHNAWQLATAP